MTDRGESRGSDAEEGLLISVVLCTYNPSPVLLRRAITSLVDQSIPPSQYEVLVIDNNSAPAVQPSVLTPLTCEARLIREERQGLTFARERGIRESRGALLVFVDDDNRLAEDYLEEALRIACENPEIGAFGGPTVADPPLKVGTWKEPLLPYLGVRDYGDAVITSAEQRPGPWDPIGAGMVVRREVANHFIHLLESNTSIARLGRSGTALLSQEDVLIARCANLRGFACSYQPSLRLYHSVEPERTRARYLTLLMYGNGRSHVILNRALGMPLSEPAPRLLANLRVLAIVFIRFLLRGRTGLIKAAWHKGYVDEWFEGAAETKDAVRRNLRGRG